MKGFTIPAAIVAAWYVLNGHVLPKFGMRT